jgi:hypothetical protein
MVCSFVSFMVGDYAVSAICGQELQLAGQVHGI